MVKKEDKQKVEEKVKKEEKKVSPSDVLKKIQSKKGRNNKRMAQHKRNKHKNRQQEEEFDKRIIKIRRVARVYKGGKRMRLSVFLVVGDKRGRVGLGLGKGPDVRSAEEKAYRQAVKNLVMVNLKGRTIPHEVETKYKTSKIILRPAAPGTGIVAGEVVRAVLELAGVKDVLSKRFRSTNSITIAYATLKALKELRLSRL